MQEPRRLFLSYSHGDDAYRKELETHLAGLRRRGLVAMWTDRSIDGGEEWDKVISENLEAADIILLLVSAAFINSDYIWGVEVKRAMARHEAGSARVIPIIVRECEWKDAPFAKLQALPRDARPITKWSDRDEAWTQVVQGIRRVVESLPARAESPATSTGAPGAGATAPLPPAGDSPLSPDLLREVHGAAIRADMVGSRDALLAFIDPSIIASLRHGPNPSAQLQTDLDTLNRAPLPDGSLAIRAWLDNARHLCTLPMAQHVFEKARSALRPGP